MGIVKASLEILGIGIGVKKVVLLRSAVHKDESIDQIAFFIKCLKQPFIGVEKAYQSKKGVSVYARAGLRERDVILTPFYHTLKQSLYPIWPNFALFGVLHAIVAMIKSPWHYQLNQ